jgi:hypothetical protein
MRDPKICPAASTGFSPKGDILQLTPNKTLMLTMALRPIMSVAVRTGSTG